MVIQIGLVPTLLLQNSMLHTVPQKGFPPTRSEAIERARGLKSHLDSGYCSAWPTNPRLYNTKTLVQMSPVHTNSGHTRTASKSEPIIDDDELAFKAAWDEALMPPPPRPTPGPKPSKGFSLEPRSTAEVVKKAQLPVTSQPATASPTPVKHPQMEYSIENGVNQETNSSAIVSDEQVHGGHNTAAVPTPEIPSSDLASIPELAGVEIMAGEAPKVADLSVMATLGRQDQGQCRAKVKDVVQKREHRAPTNCKFPSGVKKVRLVRIRHNIDGIVAKALEGMQR